MFAEVKPARTASGNVACPLPAPWPPHIRPRPTTAGGIRGPAMTIWFTLKQLFGLAEVEPAWPPPAIEEPPEEDEIRNYGDSALNSELRRRCSNSTDPRRSARGRPDDRLQRFDINAPSVIVRDKCTVTVIAVHVGNASELR